MKIANSTASREDSISYIAAERQYMNEKFAPAIAGFRSYLTAFCPGGRYCTTAQYYIADSYYRLNEKDNALTAYQALLKISGNQYATEAATRCAEITYDKKDYSASLQYFKQMQQLAQTSDAKNAAQLGVLRCSYFLSEHQTTISIASEMIGNAKMDATLKLEARYNRAKAYLATNSPTEAVADLKILATDTRTVSGAESKYLLANQYFIAKNYREAENEVMDFAKKNTPHQYWLARSFVLLADVYIQQKNDFQAKQYLLSLQKNYTVADDIQTLINERLSAIYNRDNQSVIKQ
jgi:TolA-binding protein